MRKFWIDHFSPPAPELLKTFVSLKASDCRDILKNIGTTSQGATSFESAENRVFGFDEVVIKFYRPGRWKVEALQDELQFLKDLKGANVSAVRPVGEIGTWEGIHYLVYEAIKKPFTSQLATLDKESVRQLAHLMARVHEVGSKRQAPSRPQFEPVEMCLGCFDVILDASFIPKTAKSHYQDVVEQLIEKIGFFEEVPVQRIHGDPFSGNVMWRSDGPILMDFDDFQVAPVDLDIGLLSFPWRLETLPQNMDRRERRKKQHQLVLEYYGEIRPVPETFRSLYPLLSACRDIQFDAWFSSRWNEKDFQRSYPDDDITSLNWWEDNIQGLEQSLSQEAF